MSRRGEVTGRCQCCRHPQRIELELLLAGGASGRAVARKFSIDHGAIARHWRRHVSDERKARLALGPVQAHALAARVAEESSNVVDQLRVVRAGLFESYHAALQAADRHSTALLAARLHENLRLLAKITGELASSPLVQINNQTVLIESPQFAEFQARLIQVLGRHPAARDDVVREFEALEAQRAPLPALEHEGAHAAAA